MQHSKRRLPSSDALLIILDMWTRAVTIKRARLFRHVPESSENKLKRRAHCILHELGMQPDSFTIKASEAVQQSEKLARSQGHSEIAPLHLLSAILSDAGGIIHQMATRQGGSMDDIKASLGKQFSKLPRQFPAPPNIAPSKSFLEMISKAQEFKSFYGDSHISIDTLVVALSNTKETKAILADGGLSPVDIERLVKEMRRGKVVESPTSDDNYDVLSKYGFNMVEQAIQGKLDPVIGRDEEIRRVIRVLARRTKNNPVLIGPPGVGKTAIVEGLAQRIARGDIPKSLDVQLFSLDMGLLVAGAKYRGEFEERVKDVLKQVKESNGKIVLFIDEIHLVLGAGKSEGSSMDAANLFKPLLARGELRCIGATTLDEYRKYVEKDAAFERRFQPVYVAPPSVQDTIAMLRGLKTKLEGHYGVRIKDSAFVTAAQYADRYIPSRFLPDKAIDLIDEACADVRVTLDSYPEAIDSLQRTKLRLEIEATALEKEKDPASHQRYLKVKEKIEQIDQQLGPLLKEYESARERIDEVGNLQRKLDELQVKLADALRRKDKNLAADLEFGAIPEVENRLNFLRQSEAMIVEQNEKDASNQQQSLPSSGNSCGLVTEIIDQQHVLAVVSKWTGIPLQRLTQSGTEKLLGFESRIKSRVIGQDEAVSLISDAIIRNRSGLSRPSQPIGVFLFLGPTGVGKTELAKAIAGELFDDEKHIVRIDMSEYMDRHSTSRLIGAPPGYMGYEESGQLTEAIRRRPYNVVLFDEIEKAHPEVLDILLQTFDDGRLTDGQGRTVDFTNTLIIMTSNIIRESREATYRELSTKFRPEFINRLDDIVYFSSLTREHLHRIVERLVKVDIQSRLDFSEVALDISPHAQDIIIGEAYDPSFGARPLKRYLEKKIVTELGRMMLGRTLPNRSSVLIEGIDETLSSLSLEGSPCVHVKEPYRFVVRQLSPEVAMAG